MVSYTQLLCLELIISTSILLGGNKISLLYKCNNYKNQMCKTFQCNKRRKTDTNNTYPL